MAAAAAVSALHVITLMFSLSLSLSLSHPQCSYYLYNLARPDRNGIPINNLSADEEAVPEYMPDVLYTSENEAKIDRVLTKAVSAHSHLKPVISKRLRSVMKAKLCRMGKSLHNKNSRQRRIIIDRWREMQWCITLTPAEVRSSLVKEKENLQRELENERKKTVKLAEEVQSSRKENSALQEVHNGRKRQAQKSWDEYTPQYKRQKLKHVKDAAESVLRDKQLEVVNITVKDKRSGTTMNFDNAPSYNTEYSSTDANLVNLLLFAKERFGISNAAYHELSMLFPTLPHSNHLNQRVKELNKQWTVFPIPEGTIGVQQSLKRLLTDRVEYLLSTDSQVTSHHSSRKIRVKLTGDGTNIGNLHIVVFGFTIPEKGMRAKSAAGNHPLCIMRDTEDYEQLKLGLRDIISEASDIQKNGLLIKGTKYEFDFLLGGDWKFLACVCGIDSATATHSCIWCTCSKKERHLEKQWSIVDEECGARTVKGMNAAAALPKGSKKKFNCSNPPLFDMIPMHKVIIDNLHLFLRISDLLINLLILDIRRLDGIEKASSPELGKCRNLNKYIELLKECKIPFHFYVCQDSKKLKWRDLRGPEKHRLFANIDLPKSFPTIPHVEKIQYIWREFRRLNSLLSSESFTECEIESFATGARSWRSKFLEVYQTKNVTPYMHAFVSHVPEFFANSWCYCAIYSTRTREIKRQSNAVFLSR